MRPSRLAWAALTIAVCSAPAAGATATRQRPVLPFIEDDYPKAVAQARARKLPLFIEAWAPW